VTSTIARGARECQERHFGKGPVRILAPADITQEATEAVIADRAETCRASRSRYRHTPGVETTTGPLGKAPSTRAAANTHTETEAAHHLAEEPTSTSVLIADHAPLGDTELVAWRLD
jgi:hypothetical protein